MVLILIFSICSALYLYTRISKRSKHPPLPPGPPANPLIGHLQLVPPDHQETLFYQWGKIYGDVMHLRFPGRSVIVLNSAQAAVELLEKRGANYSDRPPFPLFERSGWLEAITFMPYGKRFQKHRRMFDPYFNSKKCLEYQSIQIREARLLLQNLVLDDDKRDDYLRRFSTSIIMQVAFGHQITSHNDPYVKIAEDVGFAISNGGPPGSTPIDFFPFLWYLPSWFPGTHYARFARDYRPVIDKLHNYPFQEVANKMAEGISRTSFLSAHLQTLEREGSSCPNTIEDIKGAAGVIYCAGADTTWSTLSMFFLAMVLHPEYQIRAQEEIDRVLGPGRLPDFGDRASLPYVEYILQETLRWNSAVPLGIPHRSVEDDIYNGMFIPKGSHIIANTRGITLDESVYANPFEFNPARYLPKPEGNGEPYPNGPFGFGRRICPGRHLADASLWIAMVSVLATLNISKAVGEDGIPIIPDVSFTSGITSHPVPYRLCVRPRSKAAQALIAQQDALE